MALCVFVGMLLRLFMDFYDMEVVEEEVFLKWKEEVNDEYPGKGKALFQVGSFISVTVFKVMCYCTQTIQFIIC